jgi:hypothetical protein
MRTLASAWLRRLRIGPDGTVKDRPYPLGWDAFGNFSFIRVNTSHCPILPIEAHERRLPPQPTGQNEQPSLREWIDALGACPFPDLVVERCGAPRPSSRSNAIAACDTDGGVMLPTIDCRRCLSRRAQGIDAGLRAIAGEGCRPPSAD